MKKKYFLCLLLFFILILPLYLYAGPANPHAMEKFQSDGSVIYVFMRGNEFFSWFETENGFLIEFENNKESWVYAKIENNFLIPSDIVVGEYKYNKLIRSDILHLIESAWRFDNSNPNKILNPIFTFNHNFDNLEFPWNFDTSVLNPNRNLQPNILPPHQPATQETDQSTQIQIPPITPPNQDNPDIPSIPGAGIGSFSNSIAFNSSSNQGQNLLLLLIEFNNVSLIESDSFYNNKYFGRNPNQLSIYNYFRDISGLEIFSPAGRIADNGTFNVYLPNSDFEWASSGINVSIIPTNYSGIVRIFLDMPHPITNWRGDINGHIATSDIISLTMKAIYENIDFDFRDLAVAAVFAGGDASDNANFYGQIWAHAWNFRGESIGQRGWIPYMAYGERSRNGLIGIGIAIHELGHILGLPDLYDITGESEGLGPYSIMAHGSWGAASGEAPGHRPTSMDSWSKMQLGWLNPIIVYQDWNGVVRLNEAVIVASPESVSQYFIIENRFINNRWDEGLFQWFRNQNPGGILIFHVDDSRRSLNTSDITMNNNNRFNPMVGLREADGSNFLSTSIVNWGNMVNHFFDGDDFYSFNYNTNPNSNLFDGTGLENSRNINSGIDINILSSPAAAIEIDINLQSPGIPFYPSIGIPISNPQSASLQNIPIIPNIADSRTNFAIISRAIDLDKNPKLYIPEGISHLILNRESLYKLLESRTELQIRYSEILINLNSLFIKEILEINPDMYELTISASLYKEFLALNFRLNGKNLINFRTPVSIFVNEYQFNIINSGIFYIK